MTRYLHTMCRITDPERSRKFYEALGMEFRRELPIVRDGELEATNYFFGFAGQEEELESSRRSSIRSASQACEKI
jgi:catechol 2,3-dioxygenase-like lactoylglutathione lyase family enzyme